MTFLPAVYLGFNLLQKTRFNNNAKSFIEQACVLEDNYLFSSKVDFDHKTIELVYGGGDISDSTVQMILSKKDQFNLQKANIQIIESFSKPITDIKEGLQSVYMQMDEKDIRIQQLKQDFDTLKFQLQVLQTQSELTNKFDQIITATIKNNAQDSIHLELILKQTLTKTRRGRKISPGTLNGTDSNLIILFVQNRLNTKHVLLEINNLKKD